MALLCIWVVLLDSFIIKSGDTNLLPSRVLRGDRFMVLSHIGESLVHRVGVAGIAWINLFRNLLDESIEWMDGLIAGLGGRPARLLHKSDS